MESAASHLREHYPFPHPRDASSQQSTKLQGRTVALLATAGLFPQDQRRLLWEQFPTWWGHLILLAALISGHNIGGNWEMMPGHRKVRVSEKDSEKDHLRNQQNIISPSQVAA